MTPAEQQALDAVTAALAGLPNDRSRAHVLAIAREALRLPTAISYQPPRDPGRAQMPRWARGRGPEPEPVHLRDADPREDRS